MLCVDPPKRLSLPVITAVVGALISGEDHYSSPPWGRLSPVLSTSSNLDLFLTVNSASDLCYD